VTSGDTCVTINIDGLPVVLVLPERDVDLSSSSPARSAGARCGTHSRGIALD